MSNRKRTVVAPNREWARVGWEAELARHRRKVKATRAVVDTQLEERYHANPFHDEAKYQIEKAYHNRTLAANHSLYARLMAVHNRKPKVDQSYAYQNPSATMRSIQARKIFLDNKGLVDRLLNVKSHVNMKSWAQHEEHHRQLMTRLLEKPRNIFTPSSARTARIKSAPASRVHMHATRPAPSTMMHDEKEEMDDTGGGHHGHPTVTVDMLHDTLQQMNDTKDSKNNMAAPTARTVAPKIIPVGASAPSIPMGVPPAQVLTPVTPFSTSPTPWVIPTPTKDMSSSSSSPYQSRAASAIPVNVPGYPPPPYARPYSTQSFARASSARSTNSFGASPLPSSSFPTHIRHRSTPHHHTDDQEHDDTDAAYDMDTLMDADDMAMMTAYRDLGVVQDDGDTEYTFTPATGAIPPAPLELLISRPSSTVTAAPPLTKPISTFPTATSSSTSARATTSKAAPMASYDGILSNGENNGFGTAAAGEDSVRPIFTLENDGEEYDEDGSLRATGSATARSTSSTPSSSAQQQSQPSYRPGWRPRPPAFPKVAPPATVMDTLPSSRLPLPPTTISSSSSSSASSSSTTQTVTNPPVVRHGAAAPLEPIRALHGINTARSSSSVSHPPAASSSSARVHRRQLSSQTLANHARRASDDAQIAALESHLFV